jgi:internalin A
LPEALGQLTGLQRLDLSGNQLTGLPEALGQLTRLQELALSGNQLTGLPEALGQLSRLQRFDLNDNQLTALPETLGQLTRLQRFDLNDNQLRALPETLGQLTGLQRLDLNHNQLTALPETLGQLTGLQWLNLSGNQLTALPEALGQLTGLQRLDLHDNQLTALPEALGQLTGLQSLELHDNQLTALPETLGQLTGLGTLFLHGNEALQIPPELLGPTWQEVRTNQSTVRNPIEILQYYFRTRKGDRRPLLEAKILIVGQGAVGKTSLVNQLIHERKADPTEPQTERINIERSWKILAGPKAENPAAKVQLNVWDFGGQEIMHATHQFFLTRRSLYLVVLDARKGADESRLHYWLKIIESFGGDAPILVVTNKCEPPHDLQLNETRLKLDFAPNLRGFYQVSCLTGHGIPQLRAAIKEQVRALPHVFDPVPALYFAVKEALEKQTGNYIHFTEYDRLCWEKKLRDCKDQEVLIRFLHDLGTVLNFHDPDSPYDLRDMHILNPEWVTGGVYQILTSPLLGKRQGVLDVNDLPEILKDKICYPPERHRFLINMMRKFELCFDFPDAPGRRLLVPERLSPDEPQLDWLSQYALLYRYKVLPDGIFLRFLVRMHEYLPQPPVYWRSGVLLNIDGNEALIRADTQAGRMYISVRGPASGRRAALAVIRSTFRSIHATLRSLAVEECVPLPDNPAAEPVPYDHLLRLESLGQREFVPLGADKLYDVQRLLGSVEEKAARKGLQETGAAQELTLIRTVVELDLRGYSSVAFDLEAQLGEEAVARLNDQVQEFVNAGLSFIRKTRDEVVLGTAGDNALLVFDKAEQAHHFVAGVNAATGTHNAGKPMPAQRRFRYGAATGKIVLRSQAGRREMAGTTIIRAVRLEAAGRPDHCLIDSATYAGLPPELQVLYSPETIVTDKNQVEYRAHRWVLGEEEEAPPRPGVEAKATKVFDVFLSHNSKDKAQVKEFGEALKPRGLKVWLDEWELMPGRPWYEGLEKILETVGAAAILVGPSGLAPWENIEMREGLRQFVSREMPVIPVLLPGAAEEPKLPLFLTHFHWVDLRRGLSKEGLDLVQWGITGRRP